MGRLHTASAVLVASAVIGLCAGCGAAKPPDPLGLIEGALAQQYFDAHHAIPSNQEEDLLGREAQGMLARIEAMPAPPAVARAPQVDTRTVQTAQGAAAVDEALLAAYILHFRTLPDPYAQSQLAALAGTASSGPLPLAGGAG